VNEKMERETGLEPATSSLGIWHSFEYREHPRPLRCILTNCNHRDSTTCPKTPLNGVNGVTKCFGDIRPFFCPSPLFWIAPPLPSGSILRRNLAGDSSMTS
jgi:hypothetical protein